MVDSWQLAVEITVFALSTINYKLSTAFPLQRGGRQMAPNGRGGKLPRFGIGKHKENDHESSMAWIGTALARPAR